VLNQQDQILVYIKGLMDAEDEGRANFLDKIKNQILHYRSRISNAEKELLETSYLLFYLRNYLKYLEVLNQQDQIL
jgi:hypothetical protein